MRLRCNSKLSYPDVKNISGFGDNSDEGLEENSGVLVVDLVKGGQSTSLQLVTVLSTLFPTGLGEGRADFK
jgi:hypothetical protein